MNAQLQEKIEEIKKELRNDNDFHPLLCFDANPKELEVELPDEYVEGMETLLKFIKHRDFLAKELPHFSFEDAPQAQNTLNDLTRKIEKLEAVLAKEYEEIVKDQRFDQDLHEATWLQEQISQEHFIMVKHLKPHIFEEFKKSVFNHMTDEEIKEELEIIKHREETELEAILAADIREPEFESPHIRRQSSYDLYNRYVLHLANEAYETDDHFKEIYQTIENGEEARWRLAMQIKEVLPAARRRIDAAACRFERGIRKLCKHLCDYSREKVRTGKFQNRSDADEEKIGKHINNLKRWQVEIFVHTKHERPHLFEEHKKSVFKDKTQEEIEEFYQKVAVCEEKELDMLIRAVNNEIH